MTPNPADTLPVEPNCPKCEARIGHAHSDRCDVARCLATGLQRFDHPPTCPCPQDVWSGRPPGTDECEEFGWMLDSGFPDLNRLVTTATWDATAHRWTRPTTTTPSTDGEPR
jgi:hypothetical protein